MNGKITMLFSRDGLRISLVDPQAGIQFLDISLDSEQTLAAMSSRQGYTECSFEVRGLDKVGKKIERDHLALELPEGTDWENRKEVAEKLALEKCPEGWEPTLYFGSRDSFYYDNGKEFVRVNIVRWVE